MCVPPGAIMACAYPPRDQSTLIFIVPRQEPPTVLASPPEILEAKHQGADALWCLASDALVLECGQYAMAAAMRVNELGGTTNDPQQVGTRSG